MTQTFCEMREKPGCGFCRHRQVCRNSTWRVLEGLEDYPNIDEEFLKTAADDIKEING